MKELIFKNLSWLLFDKILRIIGSLAVGVWVARYLGPNDFGVLNYAVAYSSLFILFVKLGLDEIVVREVVRNPKLTQFIIGTAFGLKLMGSFIAILFIYLSLFFIEVSGTTKFVIFVVSASFIFESLNVIDYYFQSKVLSKYVVIARTSAFVLSSLLKIFFIVFEYDVWYFALANTIDIGLAGLFLIMIYKNTGNIITNWRFSNKIATRLLRFSWPLALSIFLISIHMKIDQVMIGNMLDTEQVGIYSIAVKLAEFWIFIPAILVSTLMPYFVRLRDKNNKLYQLRLLQLYSLMFWMGVFVGGITIIFGENIIRLLFGDVYVGAYPALVINIWNGVFISQAIARGIWLINENLQMYRMYTNIIVVVINIITNLFLIPVLGITGAAIATLVTQALGTWGISLFWRPMRASTLAMMKSINPTYLLRGI